MEQIKYNYPYYFRIKDFRGVIYLYKDIPLDVVANEIVESLSTDLADRVKLLSYPEIEVWNTTYKIYRRSLEN